MTIQADYHLHTSFSGDSNTPMEQMILKGIALGLKSMCFTEHMDMDYVYLEPQEEGIFELNTDSYFYDFTRFHEKYAPQIKLLFGVELGVQPHLSRELASYAKRYDFDFIIASSHLCNRKDPYYPYFYEGRSDEEAYREYFLSILDNVNAFTDFDVYGHLDYVVRYGKTKDAHYTYEQYKDILDTILETLIAKGKGLEINTGALGYHLRDFNPCANILKRYRELGGEIITIGSDAHEPSAIARGFARVGEILLSCGFRYYATFEKRTPSFHRL